MRPKSPKKFFMEVLYWCPGEDLKVKQISIGSNLRYFIYKAFSISVYIFSIFIQFFFRLLKIHKCLFLMKAPSVPIDFLFAEEIAIFIKLDYPFFTVSDHLS